ncbi:hypothetical protein LshimejAT787_0300060 [Lyophyllum shimeji]|uniref:Uncharacterized protein n=1 Tax=Lyophyllum shimeji TaxID=47721 RepID=A0A9P3PHU1_LYOSH|nr:hypothetical protein LshimejAT787_0300060 [Lyophyllum shimeji]
MRLRLLVHGLMPTWWSEESEGRKGSGSDEEGIVLTSGWWSPARASADGRQRLARGECTLTDPGTGSGGVGEVVLAAASIVPRLLANDVRESEGRKGSGSDEEGIV